MVVHAVAKPDTFGVNHKLLKIIAFAIAAITADNSVHSAAHQQVVAVELVENNIPTALRRLAQIVDEYLLIKCKIFKFRHFVPHNLDVGKAVDNVFKILFGFHNLQILCLRR